MNSGSRMSYYTGLFLVDMTDDLVLPAPREATTPITGYPEGFWINLVSWSQDGKHIAFTVRSPGGQSSRSVYLCCLLTSQAEQVIRCPEGFWMNLVSWRQD